MTISGQVTILRYGRSGGAQAVRSPRKTIHGVVGGFLSRQADSLHESSLFQSRLGKCCNKAEVNLCADLHF